MTHTFYIQNASRRSAQAFPITLAPNVKFADSKAEFAAMLGTPAEQIIRLTTADGHIILPGQAVPHETLLLEVERRAFDKLTGAGTFAPLDGLWSARTFSNAIFPALVVFIMFSGFIIILGGLASASDLCKKDDVDAEYISQTFAWGTNTFITGGNNQFACGLSISLFWTIIAAEFVIVIIPAIILLFWAGSFNADTKGSWAYIITCTLNILTALLAYEAFVAVPGAYFAEERAIASGKAQATIKCMAAGLIIILIGNFFWIFCQAFGKMIPDAYQCCECWSNLSPGPSAAPHALPSTGVVASNSPLATPTKQPGVVVATA